MPDTATSAWAKWFSDRQDELGLSNAGLGREIGVSGEMVRRYREGAVPNTEKLPALAKAFGVSQPELLNVIGGALSEASAGEVEGRTAADVDAEAEPPGRYSHLVQAGATWDYELTDPDDGSVRAAVQIRFMVAPDVRRRALSSRRADRPMGDAG